MKSKLRMILLGLLFAAIVIAALLLMPHPDCRESPGFTMKGTAADCSSK